MTLETTADSAILKKWNLGNLPPAGSEHVGKFFNAKWEDARKEKISRLGLHQRWLDLHAQWRGKKRKSSYPRIGANHLFKIIESYCATLTEKVPIADITADDADDPMTVKAFAREAVEWWLDTEQQFSLHASVMQQQIYGTTIEKGVWDVEKQEPAILQRDNFNIFPCPGYRMCDMDIPYFCDVELMEPWEIKSQFGLDEDLIIPTDADEQIAGTVRETTRGGNPESDTGKHYPSNYAPIQDQSKSETLKNKTLVVEIWVRDKSVSREPVTEQVEITDDMDRGTGQVQEVETGDILEKPVYLDGIRKIVICPALMKDMNIKGVLDDSDNPNINWNLLDIRIAMLLQGGMQNEETGKPMGEDEITHWVYDRAKTCYPLWGQFPYSAIPARIDTTQWWGFSTIEQLEELQGQAEKMMTKYFTAKDRQMFPILDLPQSCGVEKSEITNAPGIIIQSQGLAGQGIRYIEPPSPPRDYLEDVQFIMMQTDIISMSPEVTEGRRPKGISAAAAIIALQDKAATLSAPQVRQVDKLARNRGRMYMHFKMNFDTSYKQVKVDDELVKFRGIDVFSNFKYNVESGSSAPITKAGRRSQYVELFKAGAMDIESLLDMLEIPNAKLIVERLTEQNSVPGALQILVDAGLPPEVAQQIYLMVAGDQNGPKPQGGTTMPTAEKAGGYSEGMNSANNQMSENREA